MKTRFSSLAFVLLASSMCLAQQATSSTPAATQHLATAGQQHGVFTVELAKDINSKKLKVGDPIEAKVFSAIDVSNGTTIPPGSQIIGHVTEVTLRSKGSEQSTLGIAFDKIQLAKGEEIPIKGFIQAMAPNPNKPLNTGGYIEYGNSLNMQTQRPPAPPSSSQQQVPLLNNESTGVLGIKGLQLDKNGVLTSNAKEIKIDSGTRMLLNVTM
ncbi:MAG TPA: hypothetical protein VKV05_08945 [Terriglobales bacterium]|nr:hypothetical protein [Terriglobales bacterium]